MSLTIRKQGILERVSTVEVRIKQTGAKGYTLEGEDVTTTMTSLIARRLVDKQSDNNKFALTEAGRSALRKLAVGTGSSGNDVLPERNPEARPERHQPQRGQ